MDGSTPLGDGRPAWGGESDGASRTMLPPRMAGAPRGISGDGLPPRPSAGTSVSKKRRSTFVVPSRPPARQLLVPAASYLAMSSTPRHSRSPTASGHARYPTTRSHPAASYLASSLKRLHPAPAFLLRCAMRQQ
ncbi:unnamed protein product [Urochloa humidicola]